MAAAKETILDALGIENLSPDEQEELLLDINELVLRGALMRLVGTMDGETKDDFEKLLDSDPDDEEVEWFLEERVPDSGKALEETIQEIRDDILSVTGASQD